MYKRQIHCTYYPDSKSGQDTSGVKAKGTLHWVSIAHGIPAEIRLYNRLFSVEAPLADSEKDFKEFINPDALTVLNKAILEPSLKNANLGDFFQFMRKGYFVKDPDSTDSNLVFNRTVTLRDGWAKKQGKK